MHDFLRAFRCLENLEDTTKRGEKEALLVSAKDNVFLKEMFYRAYDMNLTYGITLKPADGPKMSSPFRPTYTPEQEWLAFLNLLDKLNSRELSGRAAMEECKHFLTSAHFERAKWYERVINQDLKIGVNVKTFGKVWSDLRAQFGVSLSDTWNGSMSLRYPLIMEPKYDGLRITMIFKNGKGVAKTRDGLEYNEILSHILAVLGPIVVNGAVDGEILADWEKTGPRASYGGKLYKSPWGKTSSMLKTGTSSATGYFNHDRVSSQMWDEVKRDLKFWVFDSMSLDVYNPDIGCDKMPFTERRNRLEHYVAQAAVHENSPVMLVPQTIVNSDDELNDVHAQYLAELYEGSMTKMPDASYHPIRSAAMLKRKETEFIDCVILEVLPGDPGSKNAKWGGRYRVRILTSGVETSCNIRTDALRKEHWERRHEMPGTRIECMRQDDPKAVSESRFIRCVRIRDDLAKEPV